MFPVGFGWVLEEVCWKLRGGSANAWGQPSSCGSLCVRPRRGHDVGAASLAATHKNNHQGRPGVFGHVVSVALRGSGGPWGGGGGEFSWWGMPGFGGRGGGPNHFENRVRMDRALLAKVYIQNVFLYNPFGSGHLAKTRSYELVWSESIQIRFCMGAHSGPYKPKFWGCPARGVRFDAM